MPSPQEAVEPGPVDPRIRAEHVKESDQAEPITARGIVQRGCLASSPSGAAASNPEGEDPEDHPLEDPGEVARRIRIPVVGVEGLKVEVAQVGEEHPHSEGAEDGDLDDAEDDLVERRTSR
jgi:hypothetical protein